MRILTFLLIAAAVAMLSACGGSKVVPEPIIHSFTATPEQVGAGGGEVELTWEVEGAAALVLEPGGESLEPRGTKRVHIVDDTTFKLTAIGVERSVVEERAVTVERVAVDGQVVDEHLVPAPGIEVFINGEAVATTDAEGRFSAPAVKLPYTVRLNDPDPAHARRGRIYDQVSAREGTYVLGEDFRAQNPADATFDLKLSWTGGAASAPPGFISILDIHVLGKDDAWATTGAAPSPAAGSAAFKAYLTGGSEQTVDVVVLQFFFQDGPTDHTENYVRAARIENASISAGSVTDLGEVALLPITTREIPLRIDTGNWLRSVLATVSIQFPGRVPLELFPDSEEGTTVSIAVPQLPWGEAFVRGFGAGEYVGDFGDRRTAKFGWLPVASNANELSVSLSEPPWFAGPAKDSTVSSGYAIRWETALPLCVLYWSDNANGYFDIVTSHPALEGSWRDRAALGPSSGSQTMSADCYTGFTTVNDAVAAPQQFRRALEYGATGTLSTSSVSVSFKAR